MPFSCEDVPAEPRNPLMATLSARPRFAVCDACTHGTGLVATEDIGANEIVAVYPMDFIVTDFPTFYYAWTPYSSCMPHTYEMKIKSSYFDAIVVGVPSASKKHAPFAKAHFINDVKQRPGIPTRAEYERDAKRHANVNFVDCVDLVVAQTLKPIAKGTELLTAYGYSYWAPSVPQIAKCVIAAGLREAVSQLLQLQLSSAAKEASFAQRRHCARLT